MYKGSVFVSDVIEKVLLLNPTSEEYINLGVVCDRNIFHKCISRDRRYINYNCAIALRNLIFREIENNDLKKEQLLKYFREYLSSNIKKYIDDNCNINKIINLAISEFLNPNDIKIGEFKEGKVVHPCIKSISDLYIRTIKYLRSDIKTSIILLERTIENIIFAILEHEDISCIKPSSCKEKILNTLEFKKIIPSDVICQIKQLNNIFTDENIKKATSVNTKYINVLFFNIKHILEWFFNFYLEDEQYFEDIYSKAHKFFYKDNHNEVNIYDLDQLIEKGWTIAKLSETMLKTFNETVDNVNPQNVTSVEEWNRIVEIQPETKQVLLDKDNNMVGYWSIIPLIDELFIKDKRGEFFVSEINPYTMPMFITGNTYNIHFSTICLKTKYRKTSVFNKLLFSIIEFIEKLALNGVYINEIVTKASSNNGIVLSRGLGLKFLTNHVDGHGEIYWSKIVDLLDRPFLRDFEVLRSLYKSKSKEN